ncbi:MAG TPA: EamA family transporter RarD [Bacillales bacterium]|nr:EamA family transporter RarD [Bacillales bacterium]
MKSGWSNEQFLGGAAAIGAYFLWGIMPIYWKLIEGATAKEILANRILWSFVFMILVLLFTKNMARLKHDLKVLAAEPKRLMIMIGASLVITVNWYTFIWAVNHGHVVEASLGYYINPLVSVLLGIVFLKEKLTLWQLVSCGLALVGVLIMTIHTGVFPWVSLGLAMSFGFYGLLKKTVHLPAMTGLTLETSIMTLVALVFLIFFDTNTGHVLTADPGLEWLLIGTGVITAIPLLLFAAGANRISLSMVGFFQYIAPTLMLILGTLVYHESFNHEDLIAFVLIWISLVLFTFSRTSGLLRLEDRLIHRKAHQQSTQKSM